MLEVAKQYLQLGFNVIPIIHKQKIPALKQLEPYFSRRVNEDEITNWFGNGEAHNNNIGIITGAISQLIVIDIDGENSKSVFIARLKEIIPALLYKIEQTKCVTTGNGTHFYLRTGHSEFPFGIDTTVLFNGAGGEIRVKGNMGYVIAPPSIHPNGKIYCSNGQELQSITSEEWNQLLTAFDTNEASQKPITDLFSSKYKVTAGNNRHEDLLRVMESLIKRNHGILSEEKVRELAYNWNQEHCEPPLDDGEFEKLWKQAVNFISRKQADASALGNPVNGTTDKETEAEATTTLNHPRKKSEILLELVSANCVDFFTDQFQKPYARIKVDSHYETVAMDSRNFRHWMSYLYYTKYKDTLSGDDITSCLSALEGRAKFAGTQHHLEIRVAASATQEQEGIDKSIYYYDLCDSKWQCVKITKDGWAIEQAPVIFARYNNQLPQLEPLRTYPKDIMDQFIKLTNVTNEEQKLLVKVYVVLLFIPKISKAILDVHGEQGSAKTFLQKLIKSIVDPAAADTLAIPKSSGELLQQLSHNYVCVYNNLSKLDDWVSDMFCKAIEGSGATKRALYSDDDDIIYNFKRVILINGINPVAHQADLLDRTISIQLERIPKERRRKESELIAEFEKIKAEVLGYIVDTLVEVLKRQGEVKLEEYERLADFCEYGELVARCMGYKPGEFTKAYFNNSQLHTQQVLDSSPVGEAIVELMKDRNVWGPGRYSTLLDDLKQKAESLGIDVKTKGAFPKQPSHLGQLLNRVKTTLREIGITVEITTDTSTNTRLVIITRKDMGKSSGLSGPPPSSPYYDGVGGRRMLDDMSLSPNNNAVFTLPDNIATTIISTADDKLSSSQKPPNADLRDGRHNDPDDFSHYLEKGSQNTNNKSNSNNPADNTNLDLTLTFKSIFRSLSGLDASNDGLVKHYDLVTKLIDSRKFGRGGAVAMIDSMLKAGWIEQLPGGGYYREIQKTEEVNGSKR